jgi:hypothetical protein
MPKRILLLALVLFLVPMVLSACGGGVDEDNLEDALSKALNDGDTGDLEDLVCDDDKEELTQESEPVEDASVDCSVEDDSFSCDISITESGQSFDFVYKGDVEDGKICNVDVELPDLTGE